MKSNVKLDGDLLRLRLSALSAIGLAACGTSSDTDGLVVVPMADTIASSSLGADDAGKADAAPHRIAIEPRAPSGESSCTRDVSCVAELAAPPTYPFGHPYEKCNPSPLGEVGHFSPMETTQKRKDDPTLCCYVSFTGCSRRTVRGRPIIGRPMRDADDAWITADVIESNAWARTRENASDDARAEFWARGGALEHASVAEFARVSLVLLALGAPPELVEDAHRAALDEIAHAKTCFALASRFAGRAIGPGALDVSRAHGDASVRALVRDSLRDGCLGEGAAALELCEMSRAERDADLATTLDAMATDEARHAALAWRIVDFAMTIDERATCEEIARFLEMLDTTTSATETERRVAREVVRPCLAALTSRGPRRSPRADDCAHEA